MCFAEILKVQTSLTNNPDAFEPNKSTSDKVEKREGIRFFIK